MALYADFKYGMAMYGPSPALELLSPDTGPSTGGNAFIITATNMNPLLWDDTFTAGVLDAGLWTDISAGGGAVSTGADHLQMATGAAAGAVAGINSIQPLSAIQSELRVHVPSVTVYPDTAADVLTFQCRVDANNHADMRLTLATTGVLTLTCESSLAGVVVDTFSSTWTFGLSTFKILRYESIIYFMANGIVIHTFRGFSVLAVTVRFWAENDPGVAYSVTTTVEAFKFRSFIMFGDQAVHDLVTVSDYRVRGLVTPSVDNRNQSAAYAGLVDVVLVGYGLQIVPDAYTYYYTDSLRVINSTQTDVKVSFISDDQLKTKTSIKKGVGL